ncbi:MAG TPA: phosphotransferase [Rhodanobacteraceae bacterium]
MADISTDRAQARLDWTRRTLANPTLTLAAASSDASFRSYWRTSHAGQNLIVMDAPPPTEDVRPWLAIGARLADAGVHVPAVHASDIEQGFLLIEDFGSRLYLPELDVDSADGLYDSAMQTLLAMQAHGDTADLPAYDADFLRREMELLVPWFLERHLGCVPDAAARDTLDTAFDLLVDNAARQPQCFVHRDFHSRNLMLTDGANPGVIDFQGALCGPITYDLASLLRDCYITWDYARVDGWMQAYRLRLIDAGLLAHDVDVDRFRRWFDLTGLQRHLKVLGLFCRLACRDGKRAYLDDLPRVFDYVLRTAARYDELTDLATLLRDATGAHDLTQPRATHASPCAP